MMKSDAIWQYLVQFSVILLPHSLEITTTIVQMRMTHILCSFHHVISVIQSLLTRMHKYQHLLTMFQHISQCVVSHLVVNVHLLTPFLATLLLKRFLNPHELLTQWHRSVCLIKVEQSLILTNVQEYRNVPIIRHGS